jgi:hypothetical protein
MEGGRRRLFCFAMQSRRRRKKAGGGRCGIEIEATLRVAGLRSDLINRVRVGRGLISGEKEIRDGRGRSVLSHRAPTTALPAPPWTSARNLDVKAVTFPADRRRREPGRPRLSRVRPNEPPWSSARRGRGSRPGQGQFLPLSLASRTIRASLRRSSRLRAWSGRTPGIWCRPSGPCRCAVN